MELLNRMVTERKMEIDFNTMVQIGKNLVSKYVMFALAEEWVSIIVGIRGLRAPFLLK